jgi:hypothetical protein
MFTEDWIPERIENLADLERTLCLKLNNQADFHLILPSQEQKPILSRL